MSAVVPFDPRGLTFQQWAMYMVELFADQNLSIPTAETDWRDWGLALAGNGYFAQYDVPIPHTFDTWEEWAFRVIQSNIDPGEA